LNPCQKQKLLGFPTPKSREKARKPKKQRGGGEKIAEVEEAGAERAQSGGPPMEKANPLGLDAVVVFDEAAIKKTPSPRVRPQKQAGRVIWAPKQGGGVKEGCLTRGKTAQSCTFLEERVQKGGHKKSRKKKK